MKKYLFIPLCIALYNMPTLFGYGRYYSFENKMVFPIDKVVFHFAWPEENPASMSHAARYETQLYAAEIGKVEPGQATGWRWESKQANNYDGFPYKINVHWTENGVAKKTVNCLTATGGDKWAGDAHWQATANGIITGARGTDAREAIAIGVPRGCDTNPKDDDRVDWSNECCYFDGRRDWPDPV